ncbi:MAG: MarR family transcriptional regulator [Actinobacteria bacterium HGW-Actinobacteria-8]|nr:MAG: MarR family transcriptional regulator [Actinobacteria bacterium HGW-Actinobacteria-8]
MNPHDKTPHGPDVDDAAMATLVASRSLFGFVAQSLAPALDELTMPQFRVLVVLAGVGPLRMGDLAERLGVHPSTLSRTIDRLVAGEWVERASAEESRREVHVKLSDTGRALVNHVTDRRRTQIVRVLTSMPDADRAAVRRGMELFAVAAGEASPEDLLELGL